MRLCGVCAGGVGRENEPESMLLAARNPDLPSPVPDCGHPECQIARAGECLTTEQRAAVRRLDPKAFSDNAGEDPAA